MINQATIKKNLFIHEAERWKWATEMGGDNQGQLVSFFQKAVDGVAKGEAWCMAFVMFCAIEVDDAYAKCIADGLGEAPAPMEIFKSEHCLTVWNRSPAARVDDPEVGDLIIWQHYKNGEATPNGHVGIIKDVIDFATVLTLEGNTSPSVGVNREGNGVYERLRFLASKDEPNMMKVKGFLRLWK